MKVEQIAEMLQLQDRMNSAVNPTWRQAGYPYLRAVVVEGAEGMEHNGWKWWKRQTQDLGQLKLELVDILHFYLSDHMLSSAPSAEDMAAKIESARAEETFLLDAFEVAYEDLDQVGRLEYMVGLAVVRRSDMRLLLDAWADCGATEEQKEMTQRCNPTCTKSFGVSASLSVAKFPATDGPGVDAACEGTAPVCLGWGIVNASASIARNGLSA